MSKVVVLVGTIGSGKSTLCKVLADKGFLVVNDDSIVNAVHGGDNKHYEKELKPLYKGIENQILAFGAAKNRSVVVDRGVNLTKSSRKRWIGLADSLDMGVECVVFPFEAAEIHGDRRFKHDDRGRTLDYWCGVARAHTRRLEIPSLDEGFDEIWGFTWSDVSNNKYSLEKVIEKA